MMVSSIRQQEVSSRANIQLTPCVQSQLHGVQKQQNQTKQINIMLNVAGELYVQHGRDQAECSHFIISFYNIRGFDKLNTLKYQCSNGISYLINIANIILVVCSTQTNKSLIVYSVQFAEHGDQSIISRWGKAVLPASA